ncbi:MAG: hypothetical protein ACLGI6_01415 [Gammaproteobacteria bacterium]
MKDIVEFRTDRFKPQLPDECQANPGVYGAELAYWLCVELAQRGVVTSYPKSEDWGWYVDYRSADGSQFALQCGNVSGCDDRWLLVLHPYARKVFGRDKPGYANAHTLIAALEEVLGELVPPDALTWHWRQGNSSLT